MTQSAKLNCVDCDALILPETAAKHDGRCVPCYRDGPPTEAIAPFVPHRLRRFGTRNPERMTNPFWLYMIGYAGSAYGAYPLVFGSRPKQTKHPVWCFHRFGGTRTEVPDRGIVVAIGGEHEDSYDDDFCIYNDVVVFSEEASGTEIYGYPREDFQPTDFHSATLVGDAIYIIGCLGYTDDRKLERTPVYLLHLDTMQIEFIPTFGDKPGWLWKHGAVFDEAARAIVVSGGEHLVANDPKLVSEPLTGSYELDLETRRWSLCER